MTDTRKLIWRYSLYLLFVISIGVAGWGIKESIGYINAYAQGDDVRLEFVTTDIPYGGVINWETLLKTKGYSIVSGEIDTSKYGEQTIVLKISDFSRIFEQMYTFRVVEPDLISPELLDMFSI